MEQTTVKKETSIEWLMTQLYKKGFIKEVDGSEPINLMNQAKEMEKEQIFKAKNVSAKEAYEAGQSSMYCGCYEIDGCTNYEEWLYKKFKSE